MTDLANIAVSQSQNTTDEPVENVQESTEAVNPVEGEGNVVTESAVESGDQETSPETYADFVMPEGVEIDAQQLEQAAPLFKELGLNQEQAQKLVDFQASQVQASQRGQEEAFNQLKQDWQDQSKNDKEFGGDKFDESVATARAALDKFGTPELTKLLSDFGIGNHPEMIRFMNKVGALTKEDIPGKTGLPSSPQKSRTDILYPTNS